MLLDKNLFDELSKEASNTPRLRVNFDLRNSSVDKSQRMLNALEPGTELPIHRHKNTSEVCNILRGRAEQFFYDDEGKITERVLLEPESECAGVSIEAGRWHKIVALESGTVIFEAKDGAYVPLNTEDILSQ